MVRFRVGYLGSEEEEEVVAENIKRKRTKRTKSQNVLPNNEEPAFGVENVKRTKKENVLMPDTARVPGNGKRKRKSS